MWTSGSGPGADLFPRYSADLAIVVTPPRNLRMTRRRRYRLSTSRSTSTVRSTCWREPQYFAQMHALSLLTPTRSNGNAPVLQEIDAQHPLDPDRRAAIARLRIKRLDPCAQRRPRHNALHLGKKRCPPRRLGVALKPHCRQPQLLHPPTCATIHPTKHYFTFIAAGFCRGSLSGRLACSTDLLSVYEGVSGNCMTGIHDSPHAHRRPRHLQIEPRGLRRHAPTRGLTAVNCRRLSDTEFTTRRI